MTLPIHGLHRAAQCAIASVRRSPLLRFSAHPDARIDQLDQLPRIAQSLEMIQKNNTFNQRPVICIHFGNLPIESIRDSQIQYPSKLSRINSPDCPAQSPFPPLNKCAIMKVVTV